MAKLLGVAVSALAFLMLLFGHQLAYCSSLAHSQLPITEIKERDRVDTFSNIYNKQRLVRISVQPPPPTPSGRDGDHPRPTQSPPQVPPGGRP
ncbi:PREDICTED: PRUPE_3G091300 [Prunus dulcis]|uniref:PREDICTED: PRUPE_3G091300 n=1 Tax=Prunus dulcis TaxID=3755 RepID=A0A5E4EXI7_PRUDU|nr:PREDICTED: PRUPE_3G091300 [Prunus dulcis]